MRIQDIIWKYKGVNVSFRASQVVLVVKNLLASAGDARDVGLILGQEDLLEEGDPLQYSCLENPVVRGSW